MAVGPQLSPVTAKDSWGDGIDLIEEPQDSAVKGASGAKIQRQERAE